MTDVLVCFCTCPSLEVARALARTVVESRLAACVNVLPGVTSVYRWQDEVQEDAEVLLIVKTTAGAYPQLEETVRARHPYELPELIAVPVSRGISQYLSWLTDATV